MIIEDFPCSRHNFKYCGYVMLMKITNEILAFLEFPFQWEKTTCKVKNEHHDFKVLGESEQGTVIRK